MAEATPPSELKVPSRCWRKTRASRASRRERAQNRAQGLPCRLIQSRIGGHEFPNHVVCRHIQGAFRRRTHSQGHRALRTKTDSLCRRLLPRFDSYGLREQIHGYGFLSALNRAIAAQTVHVFQAILLAAGCDRDVGLVKDQYCLFPESAHKYAERFQGASLRATLNRRHREPSCDLGSGAGHRALCCHESSSSEYSRFARRCHPPGASPGSNAAQAFG